MSAVILSPGMDAVMGPIVPPDANSVIASAAHRLALSRSRLNQAVHVETAPDKPGAVAGSATSAIHQWWAQHPLRLVTDVTVDVVTTLVQPVAKRHPIALVAGAAAVGALLVWSQPWRWLLTPALVAGLLPKIISQALNTPAPPKPNHRRF